MQSQHSLELRQRQQLVLTPELQQSIRFLQLSALELHQALAQAVLENPLLESEAEYDTDIATAVGADQPALTADWTRPGRRRTGDDEPDDLFLGVAAPETLQDYLVRQLGMVRVDARTSVLLTVLMHELDQDGYLASPVEEIVAYLQQAGPIDKADVMGALHVLQSLEPAGVGARSLQECLLLQLARQEADQTPASGDDASRAVDDASTASDAPAPDVLACARRIVQHHLELLGSGNMQRLQQALGCDTELLMRAHRLILSLDPRPARNWTGSVADYVVPDVLVRKVKGQWRVALNPVLVPRVRVHSLYSQLVGQVGAEGAALRDQLYQAQSVVKSLHHRTDTILRVSQAIMTYQQGYLEHGPAAMRPLVLRDIAEMLDIHESTVSRATRYKYAQTPHGVIELRAFFSSTLETTQGDATSASAVQFMIAQLIEGEPHAKPLSDNKIAQLLEGRGVKVARRTVAKYREEAGIEPAIRRKARYALQRDD